MELEIYEYFSILGIITGLAIGFLIYHSKRKNAEEPENDERTEKAAGKAAQNAIVVEILVMAAILYGDLFGLFTIESNISVSMLFFTLLLSYAGFRHYYFAKEF